MIIFRYQIFAILFYFVRVVYEPVPPCYLSAGCVQEIAREGVVIVGYDDGIVIGDKIFYLSSPFMPLPSISDYKHYNYSRTQCE